MTYDLKGVPHQLVPLTLAVFHYALEQKHMWLIRDTGPKALYPAYARHERPVVASCRHLLGILSLLIGVHLLKSKLHINNILKFSSYLT
jgi:hypothetical protein